MKEQLFKAIGDIDEKFIEEYQHSPHHQNKLNIKSAFILALCGCLLFTFILPNYQKKNNLTVYAMINDQKCTLFEGQGYQSSKINIIDLENKTNEELEQIKNHTSYYLYINDLVPRVEDAFYSRQTIGEKAIVVSQYTPGIELSINRANELDSIMIHGDSSIGFTECINERFRKYNSEEDENIQININEITVNEDQSITLELRWTLNPSVMKEIADIGKQYNLTTIHDSIDITAKYKSHEETIHLMVNYTKDGDCIISNGKQKELVYQNLDYQPSDPVVGIYYSPMKDCKYNGETSLLLDEIPDSSYDLINGQHQQNIHFTKVDHKEICKLVYQIKLTPDHYSFAPIFQKEDGSYYIKTITNIEVNEPGDTEIEWLYQIKGKNTHFKLFIE